MDPLTTTLAVFSFATVVKDLVELAQNICDAFAKVPQNYKKAHNLASDILRTLKRMQAMYDVKKEILDSAEDLKASVQQLKQDMTVVHNDCLHLIPPSSEKIRDKFKIAFYSFWNRKQVEDLVLVLKSHIDCCHKDFLLLSSIRTEAMVNQISRVVNSETIVQVQSYSEDRYWTNFNLPQLSNARLFQFSQSHFTLNPQIQVMDTISERDLDKLIIRRELGKIETLLRHLISTWHEAPPREIVQVPPIKITWDLHHSSMSDTETYQSLLINAFQLQSLIGNFNGKVDIITIVASISPLSVALDNFGMLDDALTFHLWLVDLWKKIISFSPTNKLNAWAQLAHCLKNASYNFLNIGDKEEAYARNQEAMDIIKGKLDGNLSFEIQMLLAQLICSQENNLDIELATKAVVTVATALGCQDFQLSIDPQPRPSSTNSNLLDSFIFKVDEINSKWDSSSLHDSLFSYVTILLYLSRSQQSQGYISQAYTSKKIALVILHSLFPKYPNSRQLLEKTAYTVLKLCSSTFCNFNSLADNLAYAKECTNIYRRLLQTSFPTYIINLLDALESYSNVYLSAGMAEESEEICKEITSLSKLAMEQYQNFKAPSESDGDYQLHFAATCFNRHWFSEGIHAAHNAVEQYSALAFLDPSRSPLKLIKAVTMLCQLLSETNQYQSAIVEGSKALGLVDNSAKTDKEIHRFAHSEEHITLIDCIMKALAALAPDYSTVAKASKLIVRFDKVFSSLGNFDFISHTPGNYMVVLSENGHVDDAIKYGKDFLDTWERKYTYSNSKYTASSYLHCMNEYINIFKEHNMTNEALKCSRNAMAIIKQPSQYKTTEIDMLQCFLTNTHINILCSVGLYKEGLELCNTMTMTTKSCTIEDSYNNCHMVCGLFNLTDMQLCNYRPMEAIETARQAESLSHSIYSKGPKDNVDAFDTLNHAIYLLSEAHFDAEHTSESLVHLKKIKRKGEIKGRMSSNWKSAIDEDSRFISAITARIFFVQRSYAQAKELMFEVLEMGRQIFSERESDFPELVIDLLFAGIVLCCVNEHEAGVAFLAEVDDLQRKFSVTHPALARNVELYLDMSAQRGQWKLIQTAARAKLTCHHVDQALDLKIACADSTGLEVAE